jgi:tRNA G18 (ribose-2'-O)-methylase SpoU
MDTLSSDYEEVYNAEFENERKPRIRRIADKVSKERAKTLIAVLENPGNLMNVGAIIRTVDALGVRHSM